jgi:hypothetical protein
MKIALLGSAPSSLHLAPFGDPSWKIWGCSPGVYYATPRADAWFELHRWEPPVIGQPAKQKQWFSPEYVAWMAMRDPATCPVWMHDSVPQIPASRPLPVKDLLAKYGTFFFTSSLAWMIACAIEDILEDRKTTGEAGAIGLYGVDMAATEEWAEQRPGCQHFLLLAADLGIQVIVPPESDLLRPMPLYGISESDHWMIKLTVRRDELKSRLAHAQAMKQQFAYEEHFLMGALDDNNYHMKTWGEDRQGIGTDPAIMANSPLIREAVLAQQIPTTAPTWVGVDLGSEEHQG